MAVGSLAALGTILVGASSSFGQIEVAVVYGGAATGPDARDQLNDDTYFDFNAVAIGAAEADTLEKLLAYDVVVVGDAGYRDNGYTEQMFDALRQYLDAGGGIVTVGWYNYCTDAWSGQWADDADYITPILDGPYEFDAAPARVLITGSHPIVDGIGDFDVTANHHEYETDVDAIATSLATLQDDGSAVAIAYQDSIGRSVYLGGLYMASSSYNNGGLRAGTEDQLFEQAVSWAAGAAARLRLSVTGDCPGTMEACARNANPGDQIIIIYGFTAGSAGPVPGCPDLFVDINNPTVADKGRADANGDYCASGRVPGAICGRGLVQAINRSTCETSSVVGI
ncbi:MAG: hypothetical protein D8M59_00635 [Planctomycetes bacterium]|nr:hypothetical protein [Planctomycetota bacterium]